MTTRLRVLFTSAGRRVALQDCFRRSGARIGLEVEIHACDLDPAYSAACQTADVAFEVPRCTDPSYVSCLAEHCARHEIDLLVPTIDPELAPLSRARARFGAIGTALHVSPPEVIDVARDKRRTSQVLKAAGVPVPHTVDLDEIRLDPSALRWPVFAKPAAGSASRGLGLLRCPDDIPNTYDEPMVFQRLLAGPEYTVNIFIDQGGVLRCAIPHLRMSVRAGEVEKGRTVRDPRMTEIAEAIVTALPSARGVLCFQLFDDPEQGLRVIEVNARFGGGFPLADHAGARFADWLIAERLGRPAMAHDDWRDGVEMLRYDRAVFRG